MEYRVENFNSISDFIHKIDSRENNSIMRNCDSSNTGSKRFTLTESYQESIEILKNGYTYGANAITKVNLNSKYEKDIKKSRQFNDIVGYSAHVPNAIAGIPQSMINKHEVKTKAKVIDLCYVISANSGVSTSKIEESGAKALSIVNALELKGYRVGLNIGTVSVSPGKESLCCFVNVKSQRQHINVLKCAYLLVHPSFFRRQMFKWLETTSLMTSNYFSVTYGRAFSSEVENYDNRVKVLRENKILPDTSFYLDYGFVSENTIEDCIKKLGL